MKEEGVMTKRSAGLCLTSKDCDVDPSARRRLIVTAPGEMSAVYSAR